KAFDEMRALGWIHGPSPRLVAVQVLGCAPVVRAFEAGAKRVEPWKDAETVASGLRVPSPFADTLILDAIRGSAGTSVAVSWEAMLDAMLELSSAEGLFACPEGGATLAALRQLITSGELRSEARVVIYDTGSGLKYPEAWRAALARRGAAVRGRACGRFAPGACCSRPRGAWPRSRPSRPSAMPRSRACS